VVATIDSPVNHYLVGSQYGRQLQIYLDRFPRSRVHIIDQDDLRDDRASTLSRLFEFLDVDPDFTSPHFAHEGNAGGSQRQWGPTMQVIRKSQLVGSFRRRVPPEIRGPAVHVARRALSRPVPKPILDDQARDLIGTTLASDARLFRSLSGQPFAGWSV
jgi:hypothetical protein